MPNISEIILVLSDVESSTISRQKYGTDRAYVEEKISKWVDAKFDKGMAIALEKRRELQENNYLNNNLLYFYK